MRDVKNDREERFIAIHILKRECARAYAKWYVENTATNTTWTEQRLLDEGAEEFQRVFEKNVLDPMRKILTRHMGSADAAEKYLRRHVAYLAAMNADEKLVFKADRLDFANPAEFRGGPQDTMERTLTAIGQGTHPMFPMIPQLTIKEGPTAELPRAQKKIPELDFKDIGEMDGAPTKTLENIIYDIGAGESTLLPRPVRPVSASVTDLHAARLKRLESGAKLD